MPQNGRNYSKHACIPNRVMLDISLELIFGWRGWGQQLFTFQSPAVHWMARTPFLWKSLPNIPFTELPPPFSLKSPFFDWKVLRRIPFPKIGSFKLLGANLGRFLQTQVGNGQFKGREHYRFGIALPDSSFVSGISKPVVWGTRGLHPRFRLFSQGKEMHINTNKFFRWLPGWGGGLPTGWPGVSRPVARGQKFMCCVRNPRNINIFVRAPGREDRVPSREDRWPGWPRNCLCAKCLCAFSGPYFHHVRRFSDFR